MTGFKIVMILCVRMASSEWSGGEPLVFEMAAFKHQSLGVEWEDFTHRQARNVSERISYSGNDGKPFRSSLLPASAVVLSIPAHHLYT